MLIPESIYNMYYNTTQLSDSELAAAKLRASNQDTDILNCAIAISHEGKDITPRRIWAVYTHNYGKIQLTSVRRSVNTLIKRKKLKYKGGKLRHSCPVEHFETTERTIQLY